MVIRGYTELISAGRVYEIQRELLTMYCMIYIPREPGSLVMGILTPKPTSMTTEEIQRTSMYLLPCRKKSMS